MNGNAAFLAAPEGKVAAATRLATLMFVVVLRVCCANPPYLFVISVHDLVRFWRGFSVFSSNSCKRNNSAAPVNAYPRATAASSGAAGRRGGVGKQTAACGAYNAWQTFTSQALLAVRYGFVPRHHLHRVLISWPHHEPGKACNISRMRGDMVTDVWVRR